MSTDSIGKTIRRIDIFAEIVDAMTNFQKIVEGIMKENQRVKLTKRLLKEALITVLQTKPLSKVSIKEICDQAELNRTTFYKYYSDEYSLLMDIENDLLELLGGALIGSELPLQSVLLAIKEHSKTVRALFLGNIDEQLPQKIFSLPEVVTCLKRNVPLHYDEKLTDQLFFFLFNGAFDLIKFWMMADFNTPVEELSDLIELITKRLFV